MNAESTQLQQAQLAAIMGPDQAPFETLISNLMSSSNEQRSQAESIFNLLKQTDPNSLALKLAHLLSSSPHHEARAMSTVLLRKQLTRDDSFIWPQLSDATRSAVKNILLSSIQREDSKSISKKLCDTISELASSLLPERQWPEILPFMFQCVSSDSPKLQESAFLIFSQLAQYIGDTLIPFIVDLHTVFLNVLNNSSNPDVKIAALSAVINFVQCLTSSNDRDRFQDLLPAMMRTLMDALNSGQEATAQEALELMIELAGTEPRFLRRQIVDVVGYMLQIAEAENFEEGTRHLAVEFVITLAEARERAPGMMRKLPQFIDRLFSILMKMLVDVEDDPAWHSAQAEDEDAGETSNYSVGQECLDRLAIALGGNTIVPVASVQLQAYFGAPDWQKHHAALIALAQIAEGCSKVVPAWLSCLPIKGDLIEAKVVHEQLCTMVERSDRELLGPNNQYLPKIVAVFAEVLCAGKDLATEQTSSRMINLLRQLQQTLPPSTLASTWSSLQPQQQLALQSILSS
ncbi:importin-5-like [Olea europaea var. sylvestris]|uniref:importin-5-like n=1 Tax=Olea europaea var. sylvestris TaxID=158386 RepID=UPI000C1CFAE2|nr:importin-5-like [Olea europaea var. sylvestris]